MICVLHVTRDSSSLQGPVRLTVLAVKPDDDDVIVIEPPPAHVEEVPTARLPEPVWPVITIAPPLKDDEEPLLSTPVETSTEADIKVKLEPEPTCERSPKRESIPPHPASPAPMQPGPQPKKPKARK